jgi:hypothetical protein
MLNSLSDLRWWAPVKLKKYPHLSMKDSDSADMYFKLNSLHFEKVSYDITVGGGRESLPDTPANLVRDWDYLSSLKIDMIGLIKSSITIVEFKGFGDSSAVGQLLIYQKLFHDKFASSSLTDLCVICQFSHPDIIKAANALGVNFLLVGPGSPTQSI